MVLIGTDEEAGGEAVKATFRSLPGSFIRNAQLFSKEIENNTENVEAILDGAYSAASFTDDKLLGMLLQA